MEETMKPEVPKTDSIEALARFWDTHDVTDYEGELREVPSPFRRSDIVRVPLTPTEHEALKKLASTQGIDESALVHEWVKEKLHQS
jgi:CopG antitoxin of type II toxin-antitoxin system